MQASTALPIAAGAILFASITFNAANPKRSKSSGGFSSSAGTGRQSIDYNRAIKFSSPEYGGSLSSMRRSTEFASPEFGGSLSAARRSPPKTSSRHSRTQSLNRNIPHTPSATVSMSETLHSRNTSTSGIRRTTGQPTGRVQRKPGHYPSQALPEFTFPSKNRNANVHNTRTAGFLATAELGSENRDQRLPVSLF